MTAEARGVFPPARRTARRSRSRMTPVMPAAAQRRAKPLTVRQGRKPEGTTLHLIPLSTR